ncbi:MAG: D-alanyl-D-alanine carboxypeptidase/D-alanyl-D-alanine-endopeptidase [Bacteroidales bacterium]|jgi:D-alanyl-D-alanine carboxypeptidase/D-alanyl-D-alanine-endopeptidase (penicillin-binding protein 4)|nr:D-alanyl-D-alanine carboxypeptidase/D-alanyl-D-alanine-endopeptidase [Bacteroidales bacterium]
MKIRILQTVIIAAVTATCLSGQQKAMDAILADTTLTGTSWSICFADAVTGEMIYGHDAERNLASASVMKLYPTSVALSLLGPDYRFSTDIYISGEFNSRRGVVDGDVIIRGGGDPALGSEYFSDHYGDVTAKWTAALLAAGVRHVRGRVAAASSIYDFNPAPSGWSWGNLGQYYGAGVYDINFNDNKYKIFITGRSEGSPAVIDSVEVYGRDIVMTSHLVSSGRSDRGYVYNAPYSHSAWITGSVPADSSFALKASLPDPPMTVVKLLDRAMRNAGIRIDGSPSAARATAGLEEMTPVCVTLSPTLEEIVKVTNHESVNMYAEALRKHLGYAITGEGTFSAGGEVIRSFLDSIGCEPYEAVMLDGSGLSANNNISALMTVRLLVHMHNSSSTAPFIASLPEGAVSGTMKSYFRDEFFKGRVFAKTGTIGSAKSFAGYVTTGSGRRLAFTMFANGFTVSNKIITDYMESVVREIAENY